MRKNVKQQLALRVLSTAALMAMVSSIATAAFADTYDLNKDVYKRQAYQVRERSQPSMKAKNQRQHPPF